MLQIILVKKLKLSEADLIRRVLNLPDDQSDVKTGENEMFCSKEQKKKTLSVLQELGLAISMIKVIRSKHEPPTPIEIINMK